MSEWNWVNMTEDKFRKLCCSHTPETQFVLKHSVHSYVLSKCALSILICPCVLLTLRFTSAKITLCSLLFVINRITYKSDWLKGLIREESLVHTVLYLSFSQTSSYQQKSDTLCILFTDSYVPGVTHRLIGGTVSLREGEETDESLSHWPVQTVPSHSSLSVLKTCDVSALSFLCVLVSRSFSLWAADTNTHSIHMVKSNPKHNLS